MTIIEPVRCIVLLLQSLRLVLNKRDVQAASPCVSFAAYTIDAVGLQIQPGDVVRSGTAVTLRCKVSVSHDNIPDLNHTFQLTRDSAPVFTSTTAEDLLVYELSPARAADSGSYECLVTVKDKKKKSYSKILEVTGLQTPLLQLSTTQPFQSKEFTATCSAPEEKGALIFRFYQRFETGELLKMKELASPGNATQAALVLAQTGSPFLFCEYDLNLVSFGTRRSNRSNEVQVVVKALFISPVMNVLPSPVFEGEVVEFTCQVINPPPGIELFLKKDSRILQQTNSTLIHRFSAKDSDSGEFMCKAEWDSVQKETYKSVVVKELFSRPRLTVEPHDIFEGDTFTLTCSVANVSERVDREDLQFVIYRDWTNVSASHVYSGVAGAGSNGNYVCEVLVHSVRHSVSKQSARVAVRAKVPVSKPRLSVRGGTLVLGMPFQLLCHSDAGSLPITYVLYGPGVQNQRRTVSRPGELALFNSSGIFDAAKLGTFLCHARNRDSGPPEKSGLQLQRSTIVIEPVSRPLLGLSTTSVAEGQTLTLVCSLTHGTPPISFTWYHQKKVPPLESRTSNKLQESFDISSVKREDEGSYYCMCTNPANQTKLSNRVAVAVTLAGWKKALIATSCTALVLMLVLGCVFKKHLRRYKRGRMGELSVKSSGTKTERLSLTQAEFNQANATPGMIGKSIWSEHTSGSESDDQNSSVVAEPDDTEEQNTLADPDKGVPELPEASVKYAELNHDADHHGDDGNHGDAPVQDDHISEADNNETVDVSAGACVESDP
ncbi:platelet endothelial cell adhesion molecule isoform X2 [Betta splendens]|uniref:Platelet endothelial cell adhesion molecule n=1 Tax=Betta splendens TaxID=158456 RepID=A0A6P7N8D1_BETSP|nr:platelet endothelial cell adhesion molecule isoform X2 [Betta splendens]